MKNLNFNEFPNQENIPICKFIVIFSHVFFFFFSVQKKNLILKISFKILKTSINLSL